MDTNEARRAEALPWNGEPIVAFFEVASPRSTYRDEFVLLILESRHSFIAGCPRASMIVAGEACQRVLFEILSPLAKKGHENSVNRGRLSPFVLSPNMNEDQLYALHDELSFDQVLRLVEGMNVLPEALLSQMHVIKSLRNRAAHGCLPVVFEWDPDEPRLGTDWIFDESVEFPEGYQFVANKRHDEMFTFDPREYGCRSLKSLTAEERLAAIQYTLIMDTMKKLTLIGW